MTLKKHIGCCGSGLAASMGESATAIGSGRAVCPMPASSRRPRPTARSGSWPGYSSGFTVTHRCMAVGSLGRPPRSLATRTVALAPTLDRGRWEPHADREPSSSIPSRAAAAHSDGKRGPDVPCLGRISVRGKDRAVSSRQLRRRTIGPGRGRGGHSDFVPPEVPRGPHRPPPAIVTVPGLTEPGSDVRPREGPCGELRQLRRRTIGPGRGGAHRIVPAEVPTPPPPPTAMCGGLSDGLVGCCWRTVR